MPHKPRKKTLNQLAQENAPSTQYRNYFIAISKGTSLKCQKRAEIGNGILLYDKGFYIDALKCFHRGLPYIARCSWYVYEYIGKCHKRLDEFKEARIALEKALNLKPQRIELYMELSLILYKMELYEEVIECCEDGLLEIGSTDDKLYNQRKLALFLDKGKALYKLEKYPESLAMFIEANKINPNDYLVLFNMGNALRKLGKYQESLSCTILCIVNDNFSDPIYWRNISITYKKMGNMQASEISTHIEDLVKEKVPHANTRDKILERFTKIIQEESLKHV
jgi:tetratricopeptide (TPR) repeat protein